MKISKRTVIVTGGALFLIMLVHVYFNSGTQSMHKNILQKGKSSITYSNYNTRRPVMHIAFLKIHKASSSTIQNLFFRHGYNNDLTFVLPVKGVTISMTESVIVNKTALPPPPNKTFDLLCNHCLYDRTKFEKVLPKDTVYIGSVREPLHQFLSSVNYYRIKSVLDIKGPRPIRTFLQRQIDKRKRNDLGTKIAKTNNQMSYDYGFPRHLFFEYEDEAVKRYISKLDNELDLVIVTDFFDESMVLLWHLLQWKFKEVIYVKLNEKPKYNRKLLTAKEEERTLYKQWALIDYALYNHFYKKMKNLIEKKGEMFQREVTNYRNLRAKVEKFCVLDKRSNFSMLEIDETLWNEKFTIDKKDCDQMTISAPNFLEKVKQKQLGEDYYMYKREV